MFKLSLDKKAKNDKRTIRELIDAGELSPDFVKSVMEVLEMPLRFACLGHALYANQERFESELRERLGITKDKSEG